MATVSVTHRAGDEFRVETRDHVVLVDQPGDDGGIGPTPVELLIRPKVGRPRAARNRCHARRCAVHNTLRVPPLVEVAVAATNLAPTGGTA
ncbi:hypothetical protein [Amycolatopsis pithecellobii]|uniref:Uncharacterized protein n=1 Tax=Amycolatopsis pithecellobii TaxID=664692 RepID=A0A6N7Z3B5_9PSEU|nr:hypothetical protein [Amycolatopsis pithecellobii]MTD54590.1 hypothetical protein [Amycolatopsis pithecellobii]